MTIPRLDMGGLLLYEYAGAGKDTVRQVVSYHKWVVFMLGKLVELRRGRG